MRDALSIMDQLVSFSGGSISGDSVSRLLGLVEADLLADISSAVFRSQGSRALELVEDALIRGYSIEELIDALNGFLRNALLASAGAEKGISDLSDGELELVRSTVAGIADVHVLNVLRLLSGASEQIRLGASPRVSVEGALLTASKLGIAFGINDLPPVAEKVAVKAVLPSGDGPATKPAPEPEPEAEIEVEDEQATEPDNAQEAPDLTGETREKEKEVIREISGLFDMIPESE